MRIAAEVSSRMLSRSAVRVALGRTKRRSRFRSKSGVIRQRFMTADKGIEANNSRLNVNSRPSVDDHRSAACDSAIKNQLPRSRLYVKHAAVCRGRPNSPSDALMLPQWILRPVVVIRLCTDDGEHG